MPTRVLITVDTELTWRQHDARLSWRDNFRRSYEAAGVGVPYQLARLAEHDLKACFFVDPMPALLFGIAPIEAMVAPILAAGQEVQLHLHSFWYDLAFRREPPRYELNDFDRDEQRDLLTVARNLLVAAGAPVPSAFRAGSYGANADTLGALADLGFRYDSSHNGSHHPSPSDLPLPRELVDPIECRGIVEAPISQIALPGGGLRHLQICALSIREMRAALDHAAAKDHRLVTIVGHSFELATRDGLRPNRIVQSRFDRLCEHLAAHRGSMPTAHFADLGDLCLEGASDPLPAAPWMSAERVAQQVWADARYERPATALTALSGSSTLGAELLIALIGS